MSIYDYLNNLLSYSLIKKNESYRCGECQSDVLADKVYKILSLPNNLLITMVYKQSETGKFLRLKNFMELDMKDFIHKEFYNSKTNPFHLEPESNYKYKLTSLIVYSSSNPTRDGYLTYVKQKDGSWIKFSK